MKNLILSIIEALKAMLKISEKEPEEIKGKDYNPPPKHFRNERILVGASKEVGVKEVAGKGNNQRVVKYHAYARLDNDLTMAQPDSTAWCASFVAFVLEYHCGMGSTNSMLARSYQKWGISTRKKPLPGDIVVFSRNNSTWQGHVGFYLKSDKNYVWCLGGNQRDSVNVAKYPKNSSRMKLLDIRRSSKHVPITEPMEDLLHSMAEKIINGQKVELGGKVS